jgi:hypothetical protein
MIFSVKHKGFRQFYEIGRIANIRPSHSYAKCCFFEELENQWGQKQKTRTGVYTILLVSKFPLGDPD